MPMNYLKIQRKDKFTIKQEEMAQINFKVGNIMVTLEADLDFLVEALDSLAEDLGALEALVESI